MQDQSDMTILKNKITIPVTKESNKESAEIKVKSLLIDNGFYEVINNPFSSDKTNNSVQVDNPLDSNKNFLRANLKKLTRRKSSIQRKKTKRFYKVIRTF